MHGYAILQTSVYACNLLKNLKVTALLENSMYYIVCMRLIYVLILCMHPIMVHVYTLLKTKYENHTKIGMFREFTPRIPNLV